jgi:hypothetical protein
MIVGDFHIQGIAVSPAEADPPLIVDPDAVLTLPIPGQLFKAIPGRNSQIGQSIGGVKHEELLQSRAVDILRELFRAFTIEDPFGLWVVEAPNHSIIITRRVNNVKRYVFFVPERSEFSGPGPRKARTWVRWNEVLGSLPPEQLFKFASGELCVSQDLRQKARPNRFACVNGHCRHSAIRMAQKTVTTSCSCDLESGTLQRRDEIFSFDPQTRGHEATRTR